MAEIDEWTGVTDLRIDPRWWEIQMYFIVPVGNVIVM